jgi:hypothetical protein
MFDPSMMIQTWGVMRVLSRYMTSLHASLAGGRVCIPR